MLIVAPVSGRAAAASFVAAWIRDGHKANTAPAVEDCAGFDMHKVYPLCYFNEVGNCTAENIVDENDLSTLQIEMHLGASNDGVGKPREYIVAVEGDVDGAAPQLRVALAHDRRLAQGGQPELVDGVDLGSVSEEGLDGVHARHPRREVQRGVVGVIGRLDPRVPPHERAHRIRPVMGGGGVQRGAT